MKRSPEIPHGVILRELVSHRDARGSLAEVFRSSWVGDEAFLQWNFVDSNCNTLRGVHVHPVHSDYLVVIQGALVLGLCDLRRWSPTFQHSCLVELRGEQLQGAYIPPGVAHGFYFPEQTRYVYGVTDYWSLADELGCSWNDPRLGIPWPAIDPVLSPRDREAISLQELMNVLDAEHLETPMMLSK